MVHKIYLGNGTLLVRIAGLEAEIPEEDALALARDIIALLDPPKRWPKNKKWTPELKETLRRMYMDEGKEPREIAKVIGVSPSNIGSRRHQMGIPAHNQDRSARLRAIRRIAK
ncbi:MAG TPA: hypothetical protein VNH39_10730 [Steroidobacteraceae bacterium]|nr:hypothetical protein [Steroidobacteraceae bacterium]